MRDNFDSATWRVICFVVVAFGPGGQAQAQQSDLTAAIESIKQIAPGGQNHDAAIAAMATLNAATADQVPELLQGMDGANALARNWLRGAIQTALSQGGTLPRTKIQAYLDDKSRSSMGRLMAFELLTDDNPALTEKLIPSFVDDPSLPLRELAIAAFIDRGKSSEAADSIGSLGFALNHARDAKQVQTIVKLLRERSIEIDLKKQLGFVASWHVVGPFDNSGGSGFDVAYGPEKDLEAIDLSASYADGKDGQSLKWKSYNTVDDSAVVDLNEVIGKVKGATAYAFAPFESDREQTVDIRIGCINGNKVWVNGQEVINNEIYHVGMMTDQFAGQAQLKKGINNILFKICQNEQTEDWAQNWQFQLRVCDEFGTAILSLDRLSTEAAENESSQ